MVAGPAADHPANADVLKLLDVDRWPFAPEEAPGMVRASLFAYDFAKNATSDAWWVREASGAPGGVVPPVERGNDSIVRFQAHAADHNSEETARARSEAADKVLALGEAWGTAETVAGGLARVAAAAAANVDVFAGLMIAQFTDPDLFVPLAMGSVMARRGYRG